MPAHSKGTTERTSFRYTPAEGEIIANVVRAHAQVGITISANDAVRALIRRAEPPLPESLAEARTRFEHHIEACTACTPDRPGCPDGWWLNDLYAALLAVQPPAPPRRTTSGRRPLLPPPPGK